MCDGKKAAAAGKARSNEPVDGSKSGCPTKKKGPKKIQYIMFKSLSFLSDHNLIKDNQKDFKNTGKLYPRKHWTPDTEQWISHTCDKAIEAEIEYEVGPSGAVAETGNLVCKDDEGDPWFRHDNVHFTPGKAKLRVKAKAFDKFIQARRYQLNWSIEGMDVAPSPSATYHPVIFTVGTPEGFNGDYEPGVTALRAYSSAILVAPMNSTDPHAVVKGLMGILKFYVLAPDPNVPTKYGHPTYYLTKNGRLQPNGEGGAWPMISFTKYYGECQAIVRLVGNIIKQLGIPGAAELVYIFVIPANPKVAVAATRGGLGDYPGYALADGEVKVGVVYPPSHTLLADDDMSPGFNNYEACLKFADGGATKYYGGGMQGESCDKPQEVIQAFFALVRVVGAWYIDPLTKQKLRGLKVVEILAKREDWC